MSRSKFTRRRLGLAATVCVVASIAGGCDDQFVPPDMSEVPAVRVTYLGDPLSGVEVSLMDPDDQMLQAQAITGGDGNAFFTELPAVEPPHYVVRLRSLGEGGWLFDRDVVERLCESTEIAPLQQRPMQDLALPKSSLRRLDR